MVAQVPNVGMVNDQQPPDPLRSYLNPTVNQSPQDIMELNHAYTKLLEAESAFAEAIDNFTAALADDPVMRNHPRRTRYASKVMQSHNHVQFVNMVSDLHLDMEEDGFTFTD